MESRSDRYARRAGEEFIAASRAASAEDRARHRRVAIRYVGLLSDRGPDGASVRP